MLSTDAKLPLELLQFIIPECIRSGYYNTISRTCKTANQFARTDYKNHIIYSIIDYSNGMHKCEGSFPVTWENTIRCSMGIAGDDFVIVSKNLHIFIECKWDGPGCKVVVINLKCPQGSCKWIIKYTQPYSIMNIVSNSITGYEISTSHVQYISSYRFITSVTNLMKWMIPEHEEIFENCLKNRLKYKT